MISSSASLAKGLRAGFFDDDLQRLYGKESLSEQKQRYLHLMEQLEEHVSSTGPTLLISAPGRTELGGNHTDHNHGCIVAAAVDLDCVAAITPVNVPEIVLYSDQQEEHPIRVDLSDLKPKKKENGTAAALVRGVAAALFPKNKPVHGFHGQLHATCVPGTGISSSAAFSVLIGAALSFLYLDNALGTKDLAIAAQKAENHFFGKPCGLMDQLASAEGMTIFADFQQPGNPVLERIECSLDHSDYRLAIIDTGGSHKELTPEYAAIPEEMKAAAIIAGGRVGRDVTRDQVFANLPAIRRQAGDRALLRLLHFIEENQRAQRMAAHLGSNDIAAFLNEVTLSGRSSCTMLQNCSTITSNREQGILLALALSDLICPEAICRVHGGGFAGTVQSYIPKKDFSIYKEKMEYFFGQGTVYPIRIGRPGVCCLTSQGLIQPSCDWT